MSKLSQKMRTAFAALFFLLMCIFFVLICTTYSFLVNAVALLCLILFLFIGSALANPIDKLSICNFNVLFFSLLCFSLAVSFYLAYEMRIHLPGDTDIIFASVADLLRDGNLNEVNPRIDAVHYPGFIPTTTIFAVIPTTSVF